MNSSVYLVFIVCLVCSCQIGISLNLKNGHVLSLDSYNDQIKVEWMLRAAELSIPAQVPGGIYTDLMRNGVIGDVFLGKADVETRKYSNLDWTYTGRFELPLDFPTRNITNIVFFGVDTVANISVNNKDVGITDNMFTRYNFPVTLQIGINEIEVRLQSPMKIANILDISYPTAPDCVPDIYRGECHANQLRKMQASFAWDWGPAFPSMGLWKTVQLETYNSAVIRDIVVDPVTTGIKWTIKITVHMESQPSRDFRGSSLVAKLRLGKGKEVVVIKRLSDRARLDGQYTANMEIVLSDAQIDKWWPNGLGKQPLYQLNVTYHSQDHPEEETHKSVKMAFRHLQFSEKDVCDVKTQETAFEQPDCKGRAFFFKVNEEPVFMKGTNWIPASILPELGSNKTVVDYLLKSAKAANMNMLRVWGGGVYESDYFYQKCDELGILVWQDFMFACSMYPDYDTFLSSVGEEVQQNVRRLQHHPSIAIWAGNNENEAALRGNWYNTVNKFERYQKQYINLYVHTIRPIVNDNDPTRHYLVSSPSNGIESEKENYIAENPYDPHYGDTHYYNYIGDIWSMSTYPYTRFASEYGFQSYPSTYTINTAGASTVKDMSDLMKYRQHSPTGDFSIALQIDRYMKLSNELPSDELNREIIYYSQVVQAESMRVETEFYRQSRYDWWTMGALYWQLNDVWQAPSWSSIEFTGRWKILHYFASRFFSPILVSPRLNADKSIFIYVINDLMRMVRGLVVIETFDWGNIQPIQSERINVTVEESSVSLMPYNFSLPSGKGLRFYRYQFIDPKSDTQLSPFNYIFPFNPLQINNKAHEGMGIKIQAKLQETRAGKNKFELSVRSTSMYLFVFLEVDYEGHFSNNGFHLIDSTVVLTFQTGKNIESAQLENDINIHSIPYLGKIKHT